MSNNKVLTVAYGTFSCTLEGFDDSVSTMKVIAEYFRDLSADDRYFGAVPPQPDAEMLARIAEKEIARRVQARLDGNNLVLSADPAPDAPAAEPEAPVEPAFAKQADPAPEARPEPAPEPVEVPEAVSAEAPAPEPEAVVEPEPEAIVDPEPEAVFEPEPQPEAEQPAAPEQIAGTEAEDVPTGAVIAGAGVAGAAAAAAGSSIADKLARIRAVVSQGEPEEPAYTEDEHAEEMFDTPDMTEFPDAKIDGTAAETEPAAYGAVDAAPDAEEIAAPAVADTIADVAAQEAVVADDAVVDDLATEDPVAEEPAPEPAAAVTPEPEAAQVAADDPDDVAGILARLSADAPDAEPEGVPTQDPAAADPEPEPEPAPETEVAQVKPAPAARVIKVKRADLEAAIASGKLEEVAPDTPDTLEDIPSSLSAEDEAELLSDLAAVEAELAQVETEVPTPEADATPEPGAAVTPAPLTDVTPEAASETAPTAAKSPGSEPDVDRLLAKADAEMETPEAARNREAFAQLRGAVAASKSDTGISEELTGEEETGRYRTDLAAAIRPRRPAPRGEARDARPVPKAAPLKLVAEQRVDLPAGQTTEGPVRPRRVAAAAEAGPDGSFADYAEDMGAQSLPQLLEAAAAYLAFVENRDTFSRPQIMNKVRAAQGGEFSREDGLRSFGQLLRAGKIEKLKGGRFTATGETGFRPDARAAG
ncbi:MAG: chemotaxis protein CheA [Pseudomonadota bacterium]